MNKKLKESDLYSPIKSFLNNMGYKVKGEINDCDMVAIKDDCVIIIELKLSLNITLLLQAVERFTVSDIVYLAIPKQCSIFKKQQKKVKKLIARLGLGLIVVDMQNQQHYVEIISDPKDYTPRKNKRKQQALLKEFTIREGDTQKGGSTRSTAGLTAYRQRCIRVAQYLSTKAVSSGAEINKAITEPQSTSMLRENHYGWFDKVERGVYKLSGKGKQELPEWSEQMKKICNEDA